MRVLKATSNYFPTLGYCQGMNFVLGLLILVSGGNEIEVFWAFRALVQNPEFLIIGLFEDNMPLLKFLEFIGDDLMKKKMNNLYKKF